MADWKLNDGGLTFTAIDLKAPESLQALAVSSSGKVYAAGFSNLYSPGEAATSAPNIHSLVAIGDSVYAAADTPYTGFLVKLDATGGRILYAKPAGVTGIAAMKVDPNGSVTYATIGRSLSTISRLDPEGNPVFSNPLPVSHNTITGIALDSSGNAYLTGSDRSSQPASACPRPTGNIFVTVNLGVQAFVAKIDAQGNQVWSKTLPGSCGSLGQAIGVNDAGEVIIGGSTTSPDFPATPDAYQAAFPGSIDQVAPPNALTAGFLTRLSSDGERVLASTFIGGGYLTSLTALVLDAAGNVTVTGATKKINPGGTPGVYQPVPVDRCVPTFGIGPSPPYPGAPDVYVLRLDPSLLNARFLTFLGGGCTEGASNLALDPAGNIWVTGYTQSPDFPLTAPFQARSGSGINFVAELNPDASKLVFASLADGNLLAVDRSGAAYVAGQAAELTKIGTGASRAVVVDNITPVISFPTALLQPFVNGIAPGELMTISGHGLGPAKKVDGQADVTGRMPFLLGGTSVLFDGIPAPLVSVSDTAIVCFVPFEVAGTMSLVVNSDNRPSNAVRVGITAMDPQILSVANADGTPNGDDHPAHPGSVVVLYLSGFGAMNPSLADGLVNTSARGVPVNRSAFYIGGRQVTPAFIGSAPGMVAGIVQVNLPVPADLPAGKSSIGVFTAGAPLTISQ